MTAEAQAEGPAYAGFWRRTGAWLADQVAINGPLIAINYAVAPKAFHMRPDISPIMTPETWAMQIVWILVWIAYKGVLEGGPAGATLGKRLRGRRLPGLALLGAGPGGDAGADQQRPVPRHHAGRPGDFRSRRLHAPQAGPARHDGEMPGGADGLIRLRMGAS
jgi:hypothetical protein